MPAATHTTSPIKNMMPVNRAPTKEDKIKAAHEYEEMFFKFFIKEIMPKDIEGGLFGSGHNAEIYQSLLIDAFAKCGAKRGIGIANQIINAMNRSDPNAQTTLNGVHIDEQNKIIKGYSNSNNMAQGDQYEQYA